VQGMDKGADGRDWRRGAGAGVHHGDANGQGPVQGANRGLRGLGDSGVPAGGRESMKVINYAHVCACVCICVIR
jgi:hypothetical protein